MRSRSTDVVASLDWPGHPWQLALRHADGYISTDIRDGSFVTLESAPARLIGLLNFDNILRRLRLDFLTLPAEVQRLIVSKVRLMSPVGCSRYVAHCKLMPRPPL